MSGPQIRRAIGLDNMWTLKQGLPSKALFTIRVL
jgi:hypothetical protein